MHWVHEIRQFHWPICLLKVKMYCLFNSYPGNSHILDCLWHFFLRNNSQYSVWSDYCQERLTNDKLRNLSLFKKVEYMCSTEERLCLGKVIWIIGIWCCLRRTLPEIEDMETRFAPLTSMYEWFTFGVHEVALRLPHSRKIPPVSELKPDTENRLCREDNLRPYENDHRIYLDFWKQVYASLSTHWDAQLSVFKFPKHIPGLRTKTEYERPTGRLSPRFPRFMRSVKVKSWLDQAMQSQIPWTFNMIFSLSGCLGQKHEITQMVQLLIGLIYSLDYLHGFHCFEQYHVWFNHCLNYW